MKESYKVRPNIRIDADMHMTLKKQANRRRWSLNRLFNFILTQFIGNDKEDGEVIHKIEQLRCEVEELKIVIVKMDEKLTKMIS